MQSVRKLQWGAIFLATLGSSAAAQQRIVIQGLATVESWSTGGGSRLLARNGDRWSGLGNVLLWGAGQIRNNLMIVGIGEAAFGAASPEHEVSLEQLVLHWSPSPLANLDIGKFPSPVGAFAPRRLPDANPLIGTPEI